MIAALASHAAELRWAAGGALLCILLLLSLIDLRTRRLPNVIVLPTLWIGLLLNTAGVFAEPADAILGAVAGYGSLWTLSRLHGLRRKGSPAFGGGDLKLAGAIGAWLGVLAVFPALLIAFVAGTVAVLPALVTGRLRFGHTVPFGPALALGGSVVLLVGQGAVWRFLAG